MEDRRQVGLLAMAIVGAVMALLAPWRVVAEPQLGATLTLDLRSAELCALGQCATTRLPGNVATFGTVMTVCALGLIVVCAIRIVALLRGRDTALLAKLTLAAGVLVPVDALGVMWSHDLGLLTGARFGFLGAVGGGLFAVFASRGQRDQAPLETSIGRQAREQAEARQPSVTATTGRTPVRGLPTSIGTLKFVVRGAEVDHEGITVGARRVTWPELAKLRARRLPPDPPFEKALVVDLVPATGEPIRLLTTTLVDTTRAFTKSPTAKDNLRKLLALARSATPAIDIDDGTATFIAGDEAPILGALRQLAELEATY